MGRKASGGRSGGKSSRKASSKSTAKAKSGAKAAAKAAKASTTRRAEFESSEELSDVSVPRRRPRAFYDVNRSFPEPHRRFDVSGYEPRWGDSRNYRVLWNRKIGEGGFGDVYLAKDLRTDKTVVVKTIKPDKEKLFLVKNEIRMLRLLRKGYHTVKLLDMFVDEEQGLKALVFELVDNPDYKQVFAKFSDMDARAYLYQFALALNYTHSHGVIHRDVKSRNVLFNPKDSTFRLIDWGFGTFYVEGRKFRKWPGTRPYRSPEMFLHYKYYDYSIDMWAFGCSMASLVFARHPFFNAINDKDREVANLLQMATTVKFLGSKDYLRFRRKFGFDKTDDRYDLESLLECEPDIKPERRRLSKLISDKNRHFAVPDALDLISRLLVYDPERRFTAPETLAHPYFDPVRKSFDRMVEKHDLAMRDEPTLTDDEFVRPAPRASAAAAAAASASASPPRTAAGSAIASPGRREVAAGAPARSPSLERGARRARSPPSYSRSRSIGRARGGRSAGGGGGGGGGGGDDYDDDDDYFYSRSCMSPGPRRREHSSISPFSSSVSFSDLDDEPPPPPRASPARWHVPQPLLSPTRRPAELGYGRARTPDMFAGRSRYAEPALRDTRDMRRPASAMHAPMRSPGAYDERMFRPLSPQPLPSYARRSLAYP